MTNEKDREEAEKVINAYLKSQYISVGLPDHWEQIPAYRSAVERASQEIARISSEAYKEGYLDGCSNDGTQTERDKAMISEAVQAERIRCRKIVDAELKRQGFRSGKGSTRSLVSFAIIEG